MAVIWPEKPSSGKAAGSPWTERCPLPGEGASLSDCHRLLSTSAEWQMCARDQAGKLEPQTAPVGTMAGLHAPATELLLP